MAMMMMMMMMMKENKKKTKREAVENIAFPSNDMAKGENVCLSCGFGSLRPRVITVCYLFILTATQRYLHVCMYISTRHRNGHHHHHHHHHFQHSSSSSPLVID